MGTKMVHLYQETVGQDDTQVGKRGKSYPCKQSRYGETQLDAWKLVELAFPHHWPRVLGCLTWATPFRKMKWILLHPGLQQFHLNSSEVKDVCLTLQTDIPGLMESSGNWEEGKVPKQWKTCQINDSIVWHLFIQVSMLHTWRWLSSNNAPPWLMICLNMLPAVRIWTMFMPLWKGHQHIVCMSNFYIYIHWINVDLRWKNRACYVPA